MIEIKRSGWEGEGMDGLDEDKNNGDGNVAGEVADREEGAGQDGQDIEGGRAGVGGDRNQTETLKSVSSIS